MHHHLKLLQFVDVFGTEVDIEFGQTLTPLVGVEQQGVGLVELGVGLVELAVGFGQLAVALIEFVAALG